MHADLRLAARSLAVKEFDVLGRTDAAGASRLRLRLCDGNVLVVKVEGLSLAEALDFTDAEMDALVFVGRPIVFTVGSAEILGEFRRTPMRLTIELAQIDGGGEGVLPALARLSKAYANRFAVTEIEWIVHAVTCAEPNLKLRRVLDRRDFERRHIVGSGEAYHRIDNLEAS